MQRQPNIELSLIEECFVTFFLNPRETFFGKSSGNISDACSDTGGIVCIVIVV
jgi:hypothetical protein